MPVRPNGTAASTTNPATWGPFSAALTAYEGGRFDGIGLVLDGQPAADGLVLAGIDLDHVYDSAERQARAREILRWFAGCYAEKSPSGNGIRIFCRAQRLPSGLNRDGVELYTHGRYLTVTGHLLEGSI